MQAQITVAKVYPPFQGKTLGNIVDTNGQKWGFHPGKITAPAAGSTITVDYEENEFQGKTYFRVNRIMGNGQAAPAGAPHKSNGDGDGTAERIFVCGIVNQAVAAGKVEPTSPSEIIACVQAARTAYEQTFGRS